MCVCVVLCCVVLCCVVLCCVVLCCVVLCCVVLCCVLLCFVFCFVLFCFVLFCFVLFCFVLFCFVLFCFVLFCFVSLFLFVTNITDTRIRIASGNYGMSQIWQAVGARLLMLTNVSVPSLFPSSYFSIIFSILTIMDINWAKQVTQAIKAQHPQEAVVGAGGANSGTFIEAVYIYTLSTLIQM